LIECGLWKYDKFFPVPFIEISARDLIMQINHLEGSEDFVAEYGETINSLLEVIDMKMEVDNSMLHLIVLE
jgi:hypothetical protein